MEQTNPAPNPKNQKAITTVAIIIGVIVAIIVYCLYSGVSCSSTSSKIEVTSEPKMTTEISSLGLSPRVSATVRNKSNSSISVQLRCTIYDSNGNVTDNIFSDYVTLASGESTTLVAHTFIDYSIGEYYTKCASFGNVEYRFL